MPLLLDRKKILFWIFGGIALLTLVSFFYNLLPVAAEAGASPKIFTISRGEGFRDIAARLEKEGLVRSAGAFKFLALIGGSATKLKPGRYQIITPVSTPKLLGLLTQGSRREARVTVFEGWSVSEIDLLLSREGILSKGVLLRTAEEKSLEGKLFPDTYQFFTDSSVEEVLEKFSENFSAKAAPILKRDEKNFQTNLILASLVEREVPDLEDRKIVAGILKKRQKVGMALQVDATICYIKGKKSDGDWDQCHPVSLLDLQIDSPYNTYLYAGWPPGPIGSPGISAFQAALEPKDSPYWFYLSDPRTKKTIFAKTLEEHNRNKALYLK